jgi:uncharacterized membrane protein
MTETQSEHRKQLENQTVTAQIRQSDRGQWMGLTVAMSFLVGALICALAGHETVASVLGGTTVVSLAGAFIAGKLQQKTDLEEKRTGKRSTPRLRK